MYLSVWGLKSIHVSDRGPWSRARGGLRSGITGWVGCHVTHWVGTSNSICFGLRRISEMLPNMDVPIFNPSIWCIMEYGRISIKWQRYRKHWMLSRQKGKNRSWRNRIFKFKSLILYLAFTLESLYWTTISIYVNINATAGAVKDTLDKAVIFHVLSVLWTRDWCSYTLSREYRVLRNRYSRLLFTSEDRLCANLRVLEQSMNITSQCQCLAFAWRHRSTVMTSQCQVRKDRPWRQWRNGRSMIVCSGTICSRYKIACKK